MYEVFTYYCNFQSNRDLINVCEAVLMMNASNPNIQKPFPGFQLRAELTSRIVFYVHSKLSLKLQMFILHLFGWLSPYAKMP